MYRNLIAYGLDFLLESTISWIKEETMVEPRATVRYANSDGQFVSEDATISWDALRERLDQICIFRDASGNGCVSPYDKKCSISHAEQVSATGPQRSHLNS